jgi:hypothetical protein
MRRFRRGSRDISFSNLGHERRTLSMKYQKRNKFWMGIGAPKTSFRITTPRSWRCSDYPARISFVMNKFRRAGFIHYDDVDLTVDKCLYARIGGT